MTVPLLLTWSLLGCAAGSLVFPGGTAEVRTAWWRADRDDGDDVLRVFLSNSDLPCSFPGGGDAAFGDALQSLQLGLCREGARHVGLTLFRRDGGGWSGTFPARAGANPAALTAERPRLASGSYGGVDEAFLVQVDGLDRWYAPLEEAYVPDLGEGEVHIEVDGERLSGTFAFGEAGVFGEVARGQACSEHDGLLQLMADDPLWLCP